MQPIIGSEPKEYRAGTHRLRSPSETFAAYGTKAASMGITRLANMTGLDWVGIPVYNAIRPNSRSVSVSQGKGVTVEAAKVSALMESIEYWHAEYLTLPLRHDSYQQLVQEGNVVDVHRLPLRAGLDSIGVGTRETPARSTLRLDLPELWIDGYDLLTSRSIWLPYETIRLNKVGLDYAHTTFRIASNGLASGNSLAEAIVHAICELVERDALTLWWQATDDAGHIRRSKLDLDTVDDQECRRLLARFAEANLDVAVWDVTSDTRIPTFQCSVVEREDRVVWRPFGACWGYGAHPAPEVALSRALTEAAQSRITVIAASRDDNFRSQYDAHNDPTTLASVRRIFFGPSGKLDFSSLPRIDTPTVDGDLAVLLDRLRSVGIETVAVVDLTKPELDIPTVKVVIPGLEFYSLFVGYSAGERARGRSVARHGRQDR